MKQRRDPCPILDGAIRANTTRGMPTTNGRACTTRATGRYTKQEVIARATAAGLRSRKGLTLSPQSFGQLMRNPIYIGKIESRDYGVSTRGDFEPIVDEATFYRAQAVLDGRVVVSGPRHRNRPDFPLRGFVRCESCGRGLTGSWSKAVSYTHLTLPTIYSV